MIERIKAPVSVNLVFNHKKKRVFPKELLWEGRKFIVEKIGLHHTYKIGKILYHVFSVSSNGTFFRLVLNTENLHWSLEEISDGLSE